MTERAERRLEAFGWRPDPSGRWWKREGDYELSVEQGGSWGWIWRAFCSGALIGEGEHASDLNAAQQAIMLRMRHQRGLRPPGVVRRCSRCGRPRAGARSLCPSCYRSG